MTVKRAIIPAAGRGTRMRPLSDTVPKELFPLGNRMVLDYALEESVRSGIEEVCMVISPQKKGVRKRYSGSQEELARAVGGISAFANISFVTQERPDGLGKAIWLARDFVADEPFAVLLPDNVFVARVPALAQLLPLYEQVSTCCVGLMAVPENQAIFFTSARKLLYQKVPSSVYTPNVGAPGVGQSGVGISDVFRIERILDDDPGPVRPGEVRSVGRYILTPQYFDYCSSARQRVRGELRETDVLKEYLRAGNELYGLRIEAERFDTGSMAGYAQAFVSFIDRRL